MRLLLLDNRDSFTYNLVQIIKEAGIEQLMVCPVDEFSSVNLHDYDRFIISPGPDLPGAYPQIFQLIDYVVLAGKPVLGVCLGHQSIAQWFGADLIQPSTIAHGIRSEILMVNSHPSLFRDLPDLMQVGRYHSWAVNPENVGRDLLVTSTLIDGMVMSLRHRELPIDGVQFHPESIMTDEGTTMIENWLTYSW